MEIDDSFYNRQRYVLGDDAMHLLSQASVYLYGLKGLGVEIAKNLVLSGVKELYLDDSHLCQIEDMGSNFYITEKNIENKMTRAQASLQRISQLNSYVKVCVSPFSLDNLKEPMRNESNKAILEKLEQFSCIVLSGSSLIQIGIIDNFCRSKEIKMVVADVLGLFGIIFCDFGDNFVIKSESDEENVEFFIGHVSNEKNPILKVLNDDIHGLKDGDIVTFKDVDGMIELNGRDCEIIVVSKSVIQLKLDSTNWSKYTKNGICLQKRNMKTFHFSNFYDQCFKPTIINPDFCKMEYSRCLQLLYLSLKHFHHKYGRYPIENIESDYSEIHRQLNKLNVSFDEFNANNWILVKKLCNTSSGELQPLSAFFGGIAAQEAIKAVTQQFTPIQQWFIMECECLAPSKFDRDLPCTRYDNLRKCLGSELIMKLQNLRVFMIGCGAIGCELLKNMTMLGISTSNSNNRIQNNSSQMNNCGNIQSRIESSGDAIFSSTAEADDEMTLEEDTDQSVDINDSTNQILPQQCASELQKTSKSNNVEANTITVNKIPNSNSETRDNSNNGKIIITDNDLIEKSNLNRQFLFKECHIKQSKSLIARQSVLEINGNMNIEAHQNFVGIGTENIYSDSFYSQIDICLNALDNLESRKYMDNRCVINEKCLLESGTMSTKGHVQVIIPHLTENYSNQTDPQDKQIPYCTLKSFPAKIEHCIEWAREKFEVNFFLKPSLALKYLSSIDPNSLKSNSENTITMEDLIKVIKFVKKQPITYKECVQSIRVKFELLFNHKASQLLHCFPLNTTLQDGSLFWQFPRRPPNPINFEINDELHFRFITSYSKLLASIYGIDANEQKIDFSTYCNWISECVLPVFTPRDKSIETDESVKREDKNLIDVKVEELEINELSIVDLLKSKHIDVFSGIQYIEFDKDNSLHIEFIAALSNLRSRMYGIEEVDVQTIKKISGRIIPAIATTTSVIAGLVIIELIKFVKQCEFHEHRNAFLNLSLSQFILSEPGNCAYETVINNRGEKISFSLWDLWNVIGGENFSIRNFIDDLERQKCLSVNMILQGNRIIYMNILPGSANKLDLKLNQLLVITDDDQYVDLLISYTNPAYEIAKSNENEDIKGPRVRYWLNKNVSKII